MNKFIILALLIVGALSMQTKTASDECSFGREAILLHNIKELEFTSGKFTASRRVAAISQLECIGGSARGNQEPDVVKCFNVGQYEPHWRCEATLDDTVKLGHVIVACEGYEGPLDPYVLRDSCGLKYSLEYTSWTSFMLGYLYNAFKFFVLTPLKWGIYLAIMAGVALVIVAAIRKPAHRQRESIDKKREERESPKGVWENRLRDRKHLHSPSKNASPSPSPSPSPSRSPSPSPPSTGLAAR